MDTLSDLIYTIAKRPEIYLGKPSVQRLYAFIGGYLHGNPAANDHCLDGFTEYVAAHYEIRTDHNWACIIEFCSPDGRWEIDLFMKLFEAFQREKHQ